ncbi:MAG: hypothetical protein CL424_07540 [Acidimicrobiaceae bacterium]|nr:hypothetical protein [Acidimicrobiaceae bacterium]
MYSQFTRSTTNPTGPPQAAASGSVFPPPPPPSSGAPRPRRPRRFMSGLLTGAAVTGVAFGAATIVLDEDTTTVIEQSAPAPVEPANESGVEEAADASETSLVASIHDIVVGARPSIVSIHTTVTQADPFGRPVVGQSAGSGFVLSEDGYIVTNAHVVSGSDEISVSLDGGATIDAALVAADPRADLAVLKVDRVDLQPLPLGDSEALRVGDPVVAIGNALDLGAEPTVTSGIVSAKGRSIALPGGGSLVDLIQTDTAINPGNSGGPLLNLRGEVVGINTAVSGQGQNIGFAISIVPAQELIDQLRAGEVPRHALLGVSTRPAADGAGAEVVAIEPGSAAAAAGVEVGDVIVAVDDERIEDPVELGVAIAERRPGDIVTVAVQRDGHEARLDATLGARPS